MIKIKKGNEWAHDYGKELFKFGNIEVDSTSLIEAIQSELNITIEYDAPRVLADYLNDLRIEPICSHPHYMSAMCECNWCDVCKTYFPDEL